MQTTRRARIKKLKQQILDVTDGETEFGSSKDIPLDVLEEFLERVLWYETVSRQPLRERLAAAGIFLADPNAMDDRLLSEKLWEIIHALVALKIIPSNTDHLSDRELYEYFWKQVSRGAAAVTPEFFSRGWYIDATGEGEDGLEVHLRYYASEKDRRHYRRRYPDRTVPEHKDPPRLA